MSRKRPVAVVVHLGQVGEGGVGHGEGDHAGHDQDQAPSTLFPGPGEEDDDQRHHDHVARRIGEGQRLLECAVVVGVEQGTEDGRPAGEEDIYRR